MLKRQLLICLALIFALSSFAVMARTYGRRLCVTPGYTCVQVKKGQSWRKLWPDPQKRRIVMRVNRTNNYLYRGLIIAVPNNLTDISHMDVAPLPYSRPAHGKRVIVISMAKQAFGAYDKNGYLVHWGPISGGKGYCPDVGRACNTPRGKYRVFRKGTRACESEKYPIPNGGAPMPYCMFFKGGYAMHGSTLPGYHASHGCVRMFFEDAQWLNKNFISVGARGTRVFVE